MEVSVESGKAVGPDDICGGMEMFNDSGILTRLFNTSDKGVEKVLVPILKTKGDVQNCSNYMITSEQQFGFRQCCMFALTVLMEMQDLYVGSVTTVRNAVGDQGGVQTTSRTSSLALSCLQW